jgi:sigma-54-dependent transcriptional regulator
MVAQGLFREDLYYRLAQFPIELPPLRAREMDILELARHFAVRACAFLGRDLPAWSAAALDHLCGYGFPGNVRELKGMVERAVLLCEDGELQPGHFTLRADGLALDRNLSLRERMEQVERTLLLDCLHKNDGNRTLAARELGLPRRTLLYRLGRLNITYGEPQT